MNRLLLIIPLFIFGSAFAQQYQFSKTRGVYKEVNGGIMATTWSPAQAVFVSYNNLQLKVFNQDYVITGQNPIALGLNGFVAVINDTTATAIDGVLTDLESLDSTSSVSMNLDLTDISNPVLIAQWKNAHPASGKPGDFINFQIRLFTKTGDVEFHIGEVKIEGDTAYGNGIDGPAFGVFLASDDFSKVYSSFFLDGDTTSPFVNMQKIFETMSGTPSNGTIYRFKNKSTASLYRPAFTTLNIYPNPFSGTAQVYVETAAKAEITDLAGRVVFTGALVSGENNLELSFLEQGVYVLRITTTEGEVVSRKIEKY